MIHLGIDAGRFAVKAVGKEGYKDRFPSWIGEYRDLKLTNGLRKTDIILKTDMGTVFIGDLARDESYGGSRVMTATKVHPDTKLLILAAAARAIKDGDALKVTTGVPVEFYKKKVKEDICKLIIGEYDVEINGIRKKFSIEKVIMSVEGPSAYRRLCRGKGGVKRFLDIGSRTINFGTVINGRFIDRDSDTLDYGVDTVSLNGLNLCRKITADLSQRWATLGDETYIIGGGVRVCGPFLHHFLSRCIYVVNPDFVTAETYFEIGEEA